MLPCLPGCGAATHVYTLQGPHAKAHYTCSSYWTLRYHPLTSCWVVLNLKWEGIKGFHCCVCVNSFQKFHNSYKKISFANTLKTESIATLLRVDVYLLPTPINSFKYWWLYYMFLYIIYTYIYIYAYTNNIHHVFIYIHIHMHAYIDHIYIWRALFQNASSANPKIDVTMSMPSSEIMFWKTNLHKYVHIYRCVKSSLSNQNLWTWQGHCKLIFWNGA